MKRNFYLKASAMLSICTVIMTGCFPKAEQVNTDSLSEANTKTTTSNSNSAEEFPEHIKDNETDMLNIDANVYIPDGFDSSQMISSASTEYKKWDGESVISEFINNDIISGNNVIESNSFENTGPDDMICLYEFDDASSIAFSNGAVRYASKKYIDMSYSFYFDNFENYLDNMKQLFAKDEIDNINKTEAKAKSDKAMAILSLDEIAGTPEIYSITSDKINSINALNPIKDKNDKELNNFTEEDNAYLIVYPIEYKKVPSSYVFAMGENELLESSKAFFVYSKTGLIGFELSGIFEKPVENKSNIIISPASACEKLKEYYNSIIIDAPINITAIRLAAVNRRNYLTDNVKNCTIEPVWLLYGNQKAKTNKDENELNMVYLAYISAVTCEMIPITSIGG